MTAKYGPSDENLLRLIAEKEKELEANVAQAREDARRLVEDARRRAEQMRDDARREADALAAQAQAEIARESETISKDRLAKAQGEASQVRSRATERMPKAVDLVLQHVLGGLTERT